MSRVLDFFHGVKDSLTIWQSAAASRSFRYIAIRLLPLYAVASCLGMWFYTLDLYLADSVAQQCLVWFVWNICCMVPLYLVGALSQARFAAKITAATASSSWSYVLSETLYGIVLGLAHVLQTAVLTIAIWLFTPSFIAQPFNFVISVLSVAWATAFSGFECALITKKRNLLERIYFIETNWAYAFGYGLWLSVLYHFLPGPIALTLWQYGLLMLMMHSMRLKLPNASANTKLRVFYWAQKGAVQIIALTIDLLNLFQKDKQPDASPQPKSAAAAFAIQPKTLYCIDWKCPKGYESALNSFAVRIREIEQCYQNIRMPRHFIVFDHIGVDDARGLVIKMIDDSSTANANRDETEITRLENIRRSVQQAIDEARALAASLCPGCGKDAVMCVECDNQNK